MPTFVALLRGVNVGKAKRVPMAELRELQAWPMKPTPLPMGRRSPAVD